jgi:hypothetical protein
MANEIPKAVISKIIPKIRPKACPCCGQSKFEIHPRVVALVDSEDPLAPGYRPSVVLTCKNCQHMMLFSAKGLGVVGDTPSVKPKAKR